MRGPYTYFHFNMAAESELRAIAVRSPARTANGRKALNYGQEGRKQVGAVAVAVATAAICPNFISDHCCSLPPRASSFIVSCSLLPRPVERKRKSQAGRGRRQTWSHATYHQRRKLVMGVCDSSCARARPESAKESNGNGIGEGYQPPGTLCSEYNLSVQLVRSFERD